MTRATMADVADAAGVSVMTVSYAYNKPDRVSDSTRAKVRAAADRLGYAGPHRGAASLRRGRAGAIGVVLTEKLAYAFEDPSARRFFTGIADACLESDTSMVLLPNPGDGGGLGRIASAPVDGYVVWTTSTDDPVLGVLTDTGLPVCVQGGPRHEGMSVITIDDEAAAEAVARRVTVGARRPAVLSFPTRPNDRSGIRHDIDPDASTLPVTRSRLRGYRAGFAADDSGWSDVPVAVAEHNARSEGRRWGGELIDAGADAIAAMSDELALGVLDAARDRGVDVPARVAICGWDDTPDAAAGGITTVAQSLYDQGRDAARLVLGEIDAPEPAGWSIMVRTSTRAG